MTSKNANSCQTENAEIIGLKETIASLQSSPSDGNLQNSPCITSVTVTNKTPYPTHYGLNVVMRNHVSPDSHMAPGQTWTTYPQVACKVEMIFADFILPFPSPNDYMGCDKFHGLGGSDSNFNIVMKGDYECCILSSDDEIQECGPRVDPPSGCCSDQPYCKGSPAFPSCCSGPPCKE